jgi:hypothetical protein
MSCEQASIGTCCCINRFTRRPQSEESSWNVEKISPLKCGDLTFHGKSVAGYGTCIVNPQFGLMLDAGHLVEGAENIGLALISHGHG